VQDALRAHALVKRNVDYVIKNDSVELVDEFKGRIAQKPALAGGACNQPSRPKERVWAEDARTHTRRDHSAELGRYVRARPAA